MMTYTHAQSRDLTREQFLAVCQELMECALKVLSVTTIWRQSHVTRFSGQLPFSRPLASIMPACLTFGIRYARLANQGDDEGHGLSIRDDQRARADHGDVSPKGPRPDPVPAYPLDRKDSRLHPGLVVRPVRGEPLVRVRSGAVGPHGGASHGAADQGALRLRAREATALFLSYEAAAAVCGVAQKAAALFSCASLFRPSSAEWAQPTVPVNRLRRGGQPTPPARQRPALRRGMGGERTAGNRFCRLSCTTGERGRGDGH